METLRDLRHAVRTLRKNPGFAALTILTLALGIGATTAVFSLVNAVLLRALPYKDPQRLMFLFQPNPRMPNIPLEAFGPFNADFYDWQNQNRSFSQIAMFTTDRMNLSVSGSAVRVNSSRVTSEFFRVLGIAPELGRAVNRDDDQPGKEHVAVIGHALWQSRFGSGRDVLGKELLLNAQPYRIIGVMPTGFAFPHGAENLDTTGRSTDVWIPWAMTPQQRGSREDGSGNAIGRLRPGVSWQQAQADLSAITASFDHLHPPFWRGAQAAVRPFDVSITGASRRTLLIFLGAVGLVLLIACSNVAGLVMARATGRTVEMSVRAALGASRVRLACQLLAESVCVAAAAGILGWMAASLAIQLLIRLHPTNLPRLEETSVDWRMLLFAIGISLLSAVLSGLFPAWSGSRASLHDALKASGSRSVKGAASRFQNALIVCQVALTIVLLAGSGLLIRSFVKLQSVDKGFDAHSTVTLNVELDNRYSERQNAFFRELIDRANTLPGVEAAGAIDHLPLGGGEGIALLTVEGHPFEQTPFEARSVSPRYFAAMGISLVEGRLFRDDDANGQPRVAMVSHSFSKRYFNGGSAVGKRFYFGGKQPRPSWVTIVGVVADVRQYKLEETPPLQIYTPLWQSNVPSISIAARSAIRPDRVASDLQALLHQLDPTIAAADIRTMDQWVSEATAERRFQTFLLTGFGGMALFLSLVGLYALLAYSVQKRTAEIGIRMALGAQRGRILALVLRQGSFLVLPGIASGLMGAWALTRLMSGLLFEVQPTDTLTFFVVGLLFAGVALVACVVPARRATRVDPLLALRYE